ncbi:hypothetical protein DUNSADRAFT_17224 [Dunaliella salina]|uniref:Encoded protein n=1 Tax=Dunaliella salina TaxID=3046 RepID=A0ABQ7G252_DUNSA|nr:hypothetical protein DUNSADRAFT_17224 [Dunaliella salina]|eukprot:KAF5828676.1 hypothetical protein DUNSADRAFT_17224 [Dunaliella salina]
MLLDHIERQLHQRAKGGPPKRAPLNQQALGWGLHPNDATELATLLQDHGLAVSQEGSPSRLKSSSTRCSTPRSASRRSRGLAQRIRDATPLDITPGQGLDWSKLSLVASTDELKAEEAAHHLGSGDNDGGTPEAQGQEPAAFQMDVNSGGTVFFCLFDLPDPPRPSSALSQRSSVSAATAPPSTTTNTPATAHLPTIGSISKAATQRCGCATTPLSAFSSGTATDMRGAEQGLFRRSTTAVEDEKEGPGAKDGRRSWGGGVHRGGSVTARSSPAGSRLQSPSTSVAFGRTSSSTESKRAASARVDASLQNVGRAGVRGQRGTLALETVPSASVMTAWGEGDETGKDAKDNQGDSKEEGGPGGLASKEVQEGGCAETGRCGEGAGGEGKAPPVGGDREKGGDHGGRTYSRSNSNSSCSSGSIIISGASAPTKEGSDDQDSSGGGLFCNPLAGLERVQGCTMWSSWGAGVQQRAEGCQAWTGACVGMHFGWMAPLMALMTAPLQH